MESFKSTLLRHTGNVWHSCFLIPKEIAEKFIEGENRRVICTVNAQKSFQCALMPNGNGEYFINLNKEIRTKLKLNEGQEIEISLEKDDSKYGLPMPESFEELLKQDEIGNQIFHQLTMGLQRSLIYIIGKPKSVDLQIRNAFVVLEHLKNNQGKVDFKKLNEEMKSGLK